jgi:hypothetical protein
MLWDLAEGKHLYSLDSGDIINSLMLQPEIGIGSVLLRNNV